MFGDYNQLFYEWKGLVVLARPELNSLTVSLTTNFALGNLDTGIEGVNC
jgi:hypothetical protein